MLHERNLEYRCPRCGATTALLIPTPIRHGTYIALKCVGCAQVERVPRREFEGVSDDSASQFD
jgi:hypothetical protein